MRSKQSLKVLQGWLRTLRAKAITAADPLLMHAVYRFFYQTDIEDEEGPQEFEISEEEFSATQGEDKGGHPQIGTYTVRVFRREEDGGTLMFEQSGDYVQMSPASPFNALMQQQDPGLMLGRSVAASFQLSLQNAHASEARERNKALLAEEREAKVKEENRNFHDAINELRKQIHATELERDEANFQREQAEQREKAKTEELEAIRSRGGELAPVADQAVKSFFDRFLEQFGMVPVAQEREAFDAACDAVAVSLMRPENLGRTLELVHQGVLEWIPVAVLIAAAYGVNPGKRPPPSTWRPPMPEDDAEDNDDDSEAARQH